MLRQLTVEPLLSLAHHPSVVSAADKQGGVLAHVECHAADLLRGHGKHPPGLELCQLSGLGQLTSQEHGQQEANCQQRQEYGTPAPTTCPRGLYRWVHHTKA